MRDHGARRTVDAVLALARATAAHPAVDGAPSPVPPATLGAARALAGETQIALAGALASAAPRHRDDLGRLLARADHVDDRVRRAAGRLDVRRRQGLDRGSERLRACASTHELADASAGAALDACLARHVVLGRIRDDVWSPWRSATADDETAPIARRRTQALDDLPRERGVVLAGRATALAPAEERDGPDVVVLAPVAAEGGVRGLLEVHLAWELVDTPTVAAVERFADALGRAFEALDVRGRRRAQAAAVERLRAALADPGSAVAEGRDELPTAEVGAPPPAPPGAGGPAGPGPLAALTPRQRETLELMARGLSNAEIAELLVIGVPTVKSHVTAILRATGALNRAEAIARYLGAGAGDLDTTTS